MGNSPDECGDGLDIGVTQSFPASRWHRTVCVLGTRNAFVDRCRDR
jgi:hypothetical protein